MHKLILILFILLVLIGCSKTQEKYEINNSENAVAILKIYSYNGKSESKYFLTSLGHSFITLTNISDNYINLYGYNIRPNEEVSIGSWAINDHMGVWFNLESSYIKLYNRYDERVSVSQEISNSELEKINKYIITHDSYTILTNCTTFVISLWNQIATETEILPMGFVNNPSNLVKELKKFNSYKFKEDIIFNNNVGYYNGIDFISYQLENNND